MKSKESFLMGTILLAVLLIGTLTGCGGGGGGQTGGGDWPSTAEWASYGISGGLSIPQGASVAEVSEDGDGVVDIVLTGVTQGDYESLKSQFQVKTGQSPVPVSYQDISGCYFETEDFIYYLTYSTGEGMAMIGIGIEPQGGGDPGSSVEWYWSHNGTSSQTTTALYLYFDPDVSGLTADNITLTPNVTGAVKGTLTAQKGSEPDSEEEYDYVLTITGISGGGNLGVTVQRAGYTFTYPTRVGLISYRPAEGEGWPSSAVWGQYGLTGLSQPQNTRLPSTWGEYVSTNNPFVYGSSIQLHLTSVNDSPASYTALVDAYTTLLTQIQTITGVQPFVVDEFHRDDEEHEYWGEVDFLLSSRTVNVQIQVAGDDVYIFLISVAGYNYYDRDLDE
jgi:hypothetical protein